MANNDSTMNSPKGIKRTPDFDGPGAVAGEPIMEIQAEGEVHWNHTARVIHFLDGSFVSPGYGIPLSKKALEHPGVKRLIENEELRTKRPTDTEESEDTARLVHDTGNLDRTAAPLNLTENRSNAPADKPPAAADKPNSTLLLPS